MEISQLQYGVMYDRGTIHAIFVLHILVERSIQKKKDVIPCFIDYSKIFDTVKHASLFYLLSSLDIESHDIQHILESRSSSQTQWISKLINEHQERHSTELCCLATSVCIVH